jgi:hypothetical protein
LADALDKTSRRSTAGAASSPRCDQSASADLRATKMLIGMMKDVEDKAGATSPPSEPPPVGRGGPRGGAVLLGTVAVADSTRDARKQGRQKRRPEKPERIPRFRC